MTLAVKLAAMGMPAEMAREFVAALAADAGTVDISTIEIDGVEVTASAAELNALDITAAGTVQASKAVVVDANKDAASFRDVTTRKVKIGDSANDHTISIESASDEGANRTLTVPALGGNKTLACADLAQTFSAAQTFSSTIAAGSDATDRVTIKGIYMTPANVAVAVPTIADGASDEVAVDVSAAFSMAPAVGDAVIAIPAEALPTDCLFLGARVTATDQITVSFGTKEGGGGVTGANKNFKFLVFDLT